MHHTKHLQGQLTLKGVIFLSLNFKDFNKVSMLDSFDSALTHMAKSNKNPVAGSVDFLNGRVYICTYVQCTYTKKK